MGGTLSAFEKDADNVLPERPIASAIRASIYSYTKSMEEDGAVYYNIHLVVPDGGSQQRVFTTFGGRAAAGSSASSGSGSFSTSSAGVGQGHRSAPPSGASVLPGVNGCFAALSVPCSDSYNGQTQHRRSPAAAVSGAHNTAISSPGLSTNAAGASRTVSNRATTGASSSREPGGPAASPSSSVSKTTCVTPFTSDVSLYREQFQQIEGQHKWVVSRRFSQFYELYEQLRFKYTLNHFPSKLFQFDLEQRRRELEIFLNQVLHLDCDPMPKTQVVREFVAPPIQVQLQSWMSATVGVPRRPPLSLLEQRLEQQAATPPTTYGTSNSNAYTPPEISPPLTERSGMQAEGEMFPDSPPPSVLRLQVDQGGADVVVSAHELLLPNGNTHTQMNLQSPKRRSTAAVLPAGGRSSNEEHLQPTQRHNISGTLRGPPGAPTKTLSSTHSSTKSPSGCLPPCADFGGTQPDALLQRARGSDANLSETHVLINGMDTQLLAYLFTFLPPSLVAKSMPRVCTAFWLASFSPGLWQEKGISYTHTHAPVEHKLSGFYRLLSHTGQNLRKFRFRCLVGNEKLVEPLPFHIQFLRLQTVYLQTRTTQGIDLLSQFLEAVADVTSLRCLTLDVPFSTKLLKDLHALLLLNSFMSSGGGSSGEGGQLLPGGARPTHGNDPNFLGSDLVGGTSGFNLQELHLLFRPAVELDELDFASLEIPQEPLIEWLFKEPPPQSSSDEEQSPGNASDGSLRRKKRMEVQNRGKGQGATTFRQIPASSSTSIPISTLEQRQGREGAAAEDVRNKDDVLVAADNLDDADALEVVEQKAKQEPPDRVIPNKEIVMQGLSMANADRYFVDEFSVPMRRDSTSSQMKSTSGKRKKPPKYFTTLKKFSLCLPPEFHNTGLRRELRELGQNPAYWDELLRLPYVSPILRKVNTFFPNLTHVELDFLTENLIWCLRNPVAVPSPGGGGLAGGISGTTEETFQRQATTNFADQQFLPNIVSFTIRGNLMRVKHVKDQLFNLLLRKLGKTLKIFKFLPEAELCYLDMYKGMVFGHSYANLADELRGRQELQHLEVDWIYFNTNALRAIGNFCGQSLEILRLNSCEHLVDESIELLMHTLPNIKLLRLRSSNGLTDLTLQTLCQWAENSGNLFLELEPSYFHSAFMIAQLQNIMNGQTHSSDASWQIAQALFNTNIEGSGRVMRPEVPRLKLLQDKLDGYRSNKNWKARACDLTHFDR
ncbi:unnamed protein product [Amoebophrya sp. A120]|nr:unnamed protein product [Amoebophrya sp. A120]|eukprot:GSA120T00025000001.1